MKSVKRRGFLALVGASSAVAATTVVTPGIAAATTENDGVLVINAAAELPQPPLTAHVTQVVEGSVDLAKQSGIVTSRVLTGDASRPGRALPDLTRVVRVTQVRKQGHEILLRGVIEDRSQLQAFERARVDIILDQARGVVRAPFVGRPVEHRAI